MTKPPDFEKLLSDAAEYCRPIVFNKFSISEEDFHDAQQNAMLKSWKYFKSFNGNSSFNTWFFHILKNEILTIIARNKTQRDRFVISLNESSLSKDSRSHSSTMDVCEFSLKNIVADDASPYSYLERKEKDSNCKKLVSFIFSKMQPNHIEIIQLSLDEEFSYDQIAKKLRIPIGTVMSRVFYARKYAKLLIKKYAKQFNLVDLFENQCNSIYKG